MIKNVKNVDWSRKRFEWKKAINRSQELNRGTKHLASFLCDEYLNKQTGRCWPSNATLAKQMNTTDRSIQRYIAELRNSGWVTCPSALGKRRVLQIQFPHDIKGDNKDDSDLRDRATELSSEGDTVVAPYKNQGKNQKEGMSSMRGFSTVSITEERDSTAFTDWSIWIAKHMDEPIEVVLECLKTKQGYQVPKRFPCLDEPCNEVHLSYFKFMMRKKDLLLN